MIANLLAVVMFLLMAPAFGYMSHVRGSLLIPFVLVLGYLGSFLSHNAWENMVLLTVLGVLGYYLKKFGWSRPPFVIGLVLGPIAEDSFHKAMQLWGWEFLLRPVSMVLLALIVISFAVYIWRFRKNKAEGLNNGGHHAD
jgi:putative tricarboxylic transport membrane protein